MKILRKVLFMIHIECTVFEVRFTSEFDLWMV